MEVQVFLQEELACEPPDIPDAERLVVESGISFHQAQAELAQQAGFAAQVKIHRQKVEEFERKLLPLPPFPVVSEAEYKVWRLFLPTSYPRREWASYQFDLIPPDVLEVVRVHGHLFDEMEIRTPEVRKSDPVIFGTRGGVRYIIARWAESRLIPFEEVVQSVLGRMKDPAAAVCMYISGASALGSVVSGFLLKGFEGLGMFFVIIFLTFCAISFCSLVYKERNKRKKLVDSLTLSAQPVIG